ncbi:MAG TPA: magnesium chelatase domain-containing protein, partial [Ilumatobacteraceae bacterium]|nr:magnesium chelatase domain-containing protein [Ilumatobacteraceae bacterium]
MLAAVRSATLLGVQGSPLTVEVHVTHNGLPAFHVVGLPDESCRESRDRIRAALLSSNLQWPNRRVTVNLAGPSQRKGGSGMDLAIAVALLAANNDLPSESIADLGFIGELGLDGTVRRVPGVAPMVAAMGDVRPVVPMDGYLEASAATKQDVRVVSTLTELVMALRGDAPWPDPQIDSAAADPPP